MNNEENVSILTKDYTIIEICNREANIDPKTGENNPFIKMFIIDSVGNKYSMNVFSNHGHHDINYAYVMLKDLYNHGIIKGNKLSNILKLCTIKYIQTNPKFFKCVNIEYSDIIKENLKNLFHTYVLSDPHFNDPNVLTPRGFDDDNKHTDWLINNINQTVPDYGQLILAGDIDLKNNKNYIKNVIKKINCNVGLVRGNHDELSDIDYLDCGFNDVRNQWIIKNSQVIITHKELKNDIGCYKNIHGHLHKKECTKNSFNCSVDALNGIPKSIPEILSEMSTHDLLKIGSECF